MKNLLVKILCIVILLSINTVGAQPLPVKEQYDYINSHHDFGSQHIGLIEYIEEYSNPYSVYQYGEQMGYVLESYLVMYQTTGDKAYLIKFINLSLKIMSWRNTDYKFTDRNPNDPFADPDAQLYMDGLLLWPMAHFSNLVLYEQQSLKSLIIPTAVLSIPSSTFSPNELPTQSVYTYEYIADWLVDKQVETLQSIVPFYWGGTGIGLKKTDGTTMEMNFQSGFAGAMLYLGQLGSNVSAYSYLNDNTRDYLDRGALIADLFKSSISETNDCTCESYSHPILRNDLGNNSYWWYHRGWQILNNDGCVIDCHLQLHFGQEPNIDHFKEYVEDISHGVTDLIVPNVSKKINLYTNSNYPFGLNEMVRFHNTFTENIWDSNYLGQSGFHNSVKGTDIDIYPDNMNDFNSLKYDALGWSSLYSYDGETNASLQNLYDIIIDFYENEVLTSSNDITGGVKFYGIASTVDAQWNQECVDLTLHNRKMIYDQDFDVRNNLIVAPAVAGDFYELTYPSFAEPIITEDVFTIESSVTVNMYAGETITLKDGFNAKAGSEFTASIIPTSECTDGNRMAHHSPRNKTITENEVITISNYKSEFIKALADQLNKTTSIISLASFPNPFTNKTTIRLNLSSTSQVTLQVVDQFGRIILNEFNGLVKEAGTYNVELDGANLAEGIYYCILKVGDDQIKAIKIVLTR